MSEGRNMSRQPLSVLLSIIGMVMMLAVAPGAGLAGQAVTLRGLDQSTSSIDDIRTKALRDLVEGFTERDEVPGAALLVAQHGQVVFREAYGWADVKAKKPFTVDTMVLTASATKPLSASSVMALVDRGKISLDDEVSKYLPAFSKLKVDKTGAHAPSPTIRHLLSHTSGLFGLVGATKAGMRAVRDLKNLNLTESVEIISKEALVAQPSERFNYGGANYQVAARVVEFTTGQPFDLFMKEHLLNPLSMNETYFRPGPKDDISRVATAYKYVSEKGLIPIVAYGPDPARRLILASGGLYSSLNDLATFLQMHLNEGAYGLSRILTPLAVAEMQKKQTGTSKAEYGLGWFRDRMTKDGRALSINHPGLFGALVWIDKDRDLVGVFFTSVLWPGREALYKELQKKVLELFPAGS
jgi:CubicO group peptidase (beta-lactamase class C family)